MKKVLVILGARPNFVKVTRFATVARERRALEFKFVHTGQQADQRMTHHLMQQFGLHMDHELAIAAGSQLAQLSAILAGTIPVLEAERPDLVMVVGDVTSTLAGALAANKMAIPLAHLESGLRSGDRSMPEEMNRLLTDRLADLFFTTEPSGAENLIREGTDPGRIHFVGNTMIDTMVAFADRIEQDPVHDRLGLDGQGHVLVTMHRPSTVDDPERGARMIDLLEHIAARRVAVLPLHPRSAHNLERNGLLERLRGIAGLQVTEPLDYFAFQRLLSTSSMVLTDSGGVQEETTFRRIPCFTLRENTERPITVKEGTNELISFDPQVLDQRMDRIFAGGKVGGRIPDLWDGHATERVVQVLERVL